jgi:carbonic anhydrase
MTENTTPLLSRFLNTLAKKKKFKYALQALSNTRRPTDELIETVRGAAFAIPGFKESMVTPDVFKDFKITKTAKLLKAGLEDIDEVELMGNEQIKDSVAKFFKPTGPRRSLGGGVQKSGRKPIPVVERENLSPEEQAAYIQVDTDDTEETEEDEEVEEEVEEDVPVIDAPNLVQSVIDSVGGALSGAVQGVASMVTSATVDDAKQADQASAPVAAAPSDSASPVGPSSGSLPVGPTAPVGLPAGPDILLRQNQLSAYKLKLRKRIKFIEDSSKKHTPPQYVTDELAYLKKKLEVVTKDPSAFNLELETTRQDTERTVSRFLAILKERPLTKEELIEYKSIKDVFEKRGREYTEGIDFPVLTLTINRNRQLYIKKEIDAYEKKVAAGGSVSSRQVDLYNSHVAELAQMNKRKRYAPAMSEEVLEELEIQESARKRAKFAEAEQRTKAMPTRLELIQAARSGANMDPIPGIASGSVRGLVGNTATRRLARSAMYNPSGPEAVAFRSNQIYPGDSNNLNQGPGPQRRFAQQIPKGLNGQSSYEDAPTNVRISPMVQSILVPNYTPPAPVQPGQGRLAQRAWDNYVQDIQAVSYASR